MPRTIRSETRSVRYLGVLMAIAAIIVAGAWVALNAFQMGFQDGDFAALQARRLLSEQCGGNEIVFAGDSRIAGGIVPAALTVPAINLGQPAGSYLEAAHLIDRVLACPVKPKLIVVSVSYQQAGWLTPFFWTKTLTYGLLSLKDILDTEILAYHEGDLPSLTAADTRDSDIWPIRDLMYGLRFPSYQLQKFIRNRAIGRTAENRSIFEHVVGTRGWLESAPARIPDYRPADPFIQRHGASKLQLAFLRRIISGAQAQGVAVSLLLMPTRARTGDPEKAVLDAYEATLAEMSRAGGVGLIDRTTPSWPAELFIDAVHLNAAGARLLSGMLDACLAGGSYRGECALDASR